jgi:PUB domain
MQDETEEAAEAAMAAAMEEVMARNFDAVTKTCFVTILKLLDNIIQKPNHPVYGCINLTNTSVQNKIGNVHGGINVLLACGFVRMASSSSSSSPEKLILPLLVESDDDEQKRRRRKKILLDRVIVGRHLLAKRLVQDLHCRPDELPQFRPPPPDATISQPQQPPIGASSVFNPYQGQRFDALSAAVGHNLGPDGNYKSRTEAEVARLERQRQTLQAKSKQKGPMPRNWHATRPGDSTTIMMMEAQSGGGDTTRGGVGSSAVVGSSSSDMGLLAARAMQQNAHANSLEQQGFTTKAMRQLQKLQTAVVYDYTILRLAFPDGTVVRGQFDPDEQLSRVHQIFAMECLVDSSVLFDICDVAPPRAVLSYDSTLEQAKLVPAAKVTIRWRDSRRTSTIRPELFIPSPVQDVVDHSSYTSSSSSTASLFPTANSVSAAAAAATAATPPTAAAVAAHAVVSAADREEELLRRMMGGGGGKKKKKQAGLGASNDDSHKKKPS